MAIRKLTSIIHKHIPDIEPILKTDLPGVYDAMEMALAEEGISYEKPVDSGSPDIFETKKPDYN
jgi:hypothetical protein